MKKRICKCCGKEYLFDKKSGIGGYKYCSRECKIHADKKTRQETEIRYTRDDTMGDEWEERTCIVCKKPFYVKGGFMKICSDRCNLIMKNFSSLKRDYNHSKNQDYPERECMFCHKTFKPFTSKQSLCSKECYYGYYSLEEDKRKLFCKNCGKAFLPLKFSVEFCSAKCRQVHYHKQRRVKKEPLIRKCKLCGKEFETINPKKVFCTPEHQYLHLKQKYQREHADYGITLELTCPWCKKKFKTKNKQQKYCSKACAIKLHNHNASRKKKNP